MINGMTPDEVCDTVEKSGLRGRGGGGFLTGRKWKFARANAADQSILSAMLTRRPRRIYGQSGN
jgi:NADH:ubiquinone oxidoreductase subunit F (NADH-binding)